ncbi:hypothetical protein PTTG_04559 [Puccinia triticina 1-1 BBBD Race 1]|uniref:AB hydrolase-1 domain-containing protein n=2 Tax=Puccinia triticina TaxID=208348 RepID=A0A180H4D1_PUCT1|nr:uncharacterized protein PtA15_8A641 [Puccinia triticina]OAV99372.1 hypothetical protein PTTG_04559 [Puccinia triticina 1-1 BBBD Race 1]WAQ87735.1 hypothetical protein PtA15_8A641 [Puccinia triticina]WAR57615.1 hypothetical protein PtB15_8B667 [Puccinia triticina]
MPIAHFGRHSRMRAASCLVGRSPIRPAMGLRSSLYPFSSLPTYQYHSKQTFANGAPDHKPLGSLDRGTGYHIYHHSAPFKLDYGQNLPSFDLAYEVWGKLKYPIDLDRYFVVCANPLGSSFGSTAPQSINPLTGKRYATDSRCFDLRHVHASIGSSMGGMQSIAAAWLEPERVHKVISISGCGRTGRAGIAILLMADPNWKNGFYYDSAPPYLGMKLARQVAAVTYGSGHEWERRFGKGLRSVTDEDGHSAIIPPTLKPEFSLETWLDHSAGQFSKIYDANSWLYVSKAMELFDMTAEGMNQLQQYRAPPLDESSSSDKANCIPPEGVTNLSPSFCHHNVVASLSQTFGQKYKSTHEFLIVGVQTDVLFPVASQRDLAEAIRSSASKHPDDQAPSVTYVELDSPFGHDAFLIDLKAVGGAVKGFLA